MNTSTNKLFYQLIKNSIFTFEILQKVSSTNKNLFSTYNLHKFCMLNIPKEHINLSSDSIKWEELAFQLLGYIYKDINDRVISQETIVVLNMLKGSCEIELTEYIKSNSAKGKTFLNEHRLHKFLVDRKINTVNIDIFYLCYKIYEGLANMKKEQYIAVQFVGSNKLYHYKSGGLKIHQGDMVEVNAAGKIKQVKVHSVRDNFKPNSNIQYKTVMRLLTNKTQSRLDEDFNDFVKAQTIHDETMYEVATSPGNIESGINKITNCQRKQFFEYPLTTKKENDMKQHTYNQAQFELREYFNGTELNNCSDNEVVDRILTLQEKIQTLKKVAKRLNSKKLKAQLVIAKSDLIKLKNYFEART